ncbi:MAG TPA: RNA-binding domain-containing protein [Thermomicrobiales bacterium]|jgi:PHP family Zn ribbon phosphoesterase|nr:RNA-binding domain-containing protein [Thermomicrobiales bacterium]
MDLHLHTPASIDYQQPDVSALQILQAAEAKGLDIIAFTDHNSVRGYADLWREIEDLELLEYLKRLQPAEADRLNEYRRLLARILVLPGFEFTATFGFHILAIFPESTSVRLMEHLLLSLGVAEDRMGSGEVGATTDVLKAYEILDEHGALVLGAHVNSTHGIAMQGLRFGGQTKIAYTQDEHLHGLEVTDLMVGGGRRSTARFFNGSKAEYPRRMHCIQGSDAHRLTTDPVRETNLGIGDRPTEVELPEVSFRALKDLFLSDEFDRIRGYEGESAAVQEFREDRAEGNGPEQSFHESLSTKKTGVSHILRDIVAFANGDGGTIYVGASAFEKRPLVGVDDVDEAVAELREGLASQVTPVPEIDVEPFEADDKDLLIIRVTAGTEKPYALAPGNILVRELGESVNASRDQIVTMVRETALRATTPAPVEAPRSEPARAARPAPDDGERTSRDGRGRRRDNTRHDPRAPGRDGGRDRWNNAEERAEPARNAAPVESRGDGRDNRPAPRGDRRQSRYGEAPRYDDRVERADRSDQGDRTDRLGRRGPYRRNEQYRDDRPSDDGDQGRQARDTRWTDTAPEYADSRQYPSDASDQDPYARARDERARANRAQYEEPQGRDDRRDDRRGDPYDDRDDAGFAPVPTRAPFSLAVAPDLAPDGGEEEHISAPPDRDAPTSGVEILAWADIRGMPYFTVHDLRHEEIIRNVTPDTGRRLWRYAIEQFDDLEAALAATRWDGDYGFVKSYRPRGGERRYNIAYRGGGDIRVFFGVSDEDLPEGYRAVIPARTR